MVKRKRSSSVTRPRKSLKTEVNSVKKRVRKIECDTRDLRWSRRVIPSTSWSYDASAVIFDPMADIVLGDGVESEFQGGSICKHRLQMKFAIEGGSAEHDSVRIIVWVDKEHNNTAAPTDLTSILLDPGQAGVYSPWNRARAGQYKILYNRHILLTTGGYDPTLSTQVATSATPHYKQINIDLKIPKKYSVSKWNVDAAAFGTNRLFVGFISNSAIVPHPGPTDGNGISMLFYSA